MACLLAAWYAPFALALVPAQGPAEASATAGIVSGELASKVDAYLTRCVPFGFSGSVLVAQGDGVILFEGLRHRGRVDRSALRSRDDLRPRLALQAAHRGARAGASYLSPSLLSAFAFPIPLSASHLSRGRPRGTVAPFSQL